MKKEITKRMPDRSEKLIEFDIYEGFDDIESVEIQMSFLGLYEKNYIIIQFLSKYYGVAAPSATKALVVGKNISWIKESNIWSRVDTGKIKLPFKPAELSKGSMGNEEILEDMNTIDKDYKLLNGYKTGWRDIRGSYQYSSYYVELMGRTFYSSFFEKEDATLLILYGVASKSSLARKFSNKRIKKLNPFRTEALFVTGKVHRMLF